MLVASSPRVKAEVEKLGLQAVALDAAPNVAKHAVDLPRLAVFSTWGSTQDVGWVRYALDHFEVPYDLIYKERIKQGGLRGSYDVIVIPSQGRGGGQGPDLRRREPRQGDRLQEDARISQPGRIRRIGRYHRRHGAAGRGGVR